MMAAMFPTMVLLMMGRDMRAMEPSQLVFWGTMSVAVGAGLLLAYPVNTWMVAKGLKHGMGTVRALGKGGHSLDAEHSRGLTPPDRAPARSRKSPKKPGKGMAGMKGMKEM
jgi:hypothetical protein